MHLIKQHIFQGEFRAHCYCCLIISTAPAKQKVALVTFQHQRGVSAASCVHFKLTSSNTGGAFNGRLQPKHRLMACVPVLLPSSTLQPCWAPCALFTFLMYHSWAVCSQLRYACAFMSLQLQMMAAVLSIVDKGCIRMFLSGKQQW